MTLFSRDSDGNDLVIEIPPLPMPVCYFGVWMGLCQHVIVGPEGLQIGFKNYRLEEAQ